MLATVQQLLANPKQCLVMHPPFNSTQKQGTRVHAYLLFL